MKSIRQNYMMTLITAAATNLLVNIYIVPFIGITGLSAVASAGLTALPLCIMLFRSWKRITGDIRTIEDFFRKYSKGNFLVELDSDLKTKELEGLGKHIDATREQMKRFLYHTLSAEVHLEDMAKKLSSNSKGSLSSMQEISEVVKSIKEGSARAASHSSENAGISEELVGTSSQIASYSNNAKKFAVESADIISYS